MTYKEKLTQKIEAAADNVTVAREAAQDKLLDSPEFIEAQRVLAAKTEELKALNTIIVQLNNIKPFTAKDKTQYKVNIFPEAPAVFGPGLAQIMGIVRGTGSAFTDEMQLELETITGISALEWAYAREALGSTKYLNKAGALVGEEPYSFKELSPLLESIALQLNIHEFKVSDITEDKLDLWQLRASTKAENEFRELKEAAELDTSNFLLTDEDTKTPEAE